MFWETKNQGVKTVYTPSENLKIKSLYNCDINGKNIESRKGFTIAPEDYVFKTSGSEGFEITFKITDCYMLLDGKHGRIAVGISDNGMDNITYRMLFLSADGKKTSIGNIEFTTNDGDFGYPDSFTVFKGKPTKGIGIYFMVRRVYSNKPDYIYIRELSSDNQTWAMLTDSDIYAPLILANGRGEGYHKAEVEGEKLELPSPIMPESKNLLGSRFRAAYTTDGTSYAFSLPFAKLDSAKVSAELLYKGSKYSFSVEEGERKSAAVEVDKKELVLFVDRTVGRLYFSLSDGTLFAPEFTGLINNLLVTAYKTETQNQKKVAAMTASCGLETEKIFSQESVTFFYSNRVSPSLVMLNSPAEPLYFPENMAYSLGDREKQVIGAMNKDGAVIAFLSGEMYKIEMKTARNTKKFTLLGEQCEKADVYLALNKLADFDAEPKAESLCRIGESIFFQGLDGGVFEITKQGVFKKITVLPQVCDFAVAQNGKYLLLNGKTATVIAKLNGEYVVGEWALPSRAVGGFSHLSGTIYYFEYVIGSLYIILPSRLKGNTDHYLVSEFYKTEEPVNSKIRADITDKGRKPVRLYKIAAEGSGEKATLKLFEGEKFVAKRRAPFKNYQAEFLVGAHSVRPEIELSFTGKARLSGVICRLKTKS